MNHFAPAYVPPEDAGLFRVSEPGWYAFDDDHNAVLGIGSSARDTAAADATQCSNSSASSAATSKFSGCQGLGM